MASKSTRGDSKFLALARERFKLGQDADHDQREREISDLRMAAGDQWPDDIRQARAGQEASNGMPPVPARPCLTIDKVREPIQQVCNQERESDIGLEIVPADDFGELGIELDDTEIKLREGLVRRIQRESDAADARSWAFDRAVKCGRGYYLVTTRYVSGKSFDQEIYIHRIYNQAAVVLDPAHTLPDGSDAEWGFIGEDLSHDDYKAQFPSTKAKPNRIASASEDEWRAFGEDAPGWFTTEGDNRMCRVVNYWYTEREVRQLALREDGSTVWVDELPEEQRADAKVTRDIVTKTIKHAKIDGLQVLEETEETGDFLPIIKSLGEEVQPYDNERRAQGMVRPARDSQFAYNAMVSKWVERVALSTVPPYLVAEGQIEGYENWWNASNTRTFPWLPYKTRDLEGQPVGPPQRSDMTSQLADLAMSVQLFDEGIKATTGVPAVALGQQSDASLKSGKAIRALQAQAAAGTSNYMDNYKRSVRHEGRVINSKLYPVYGTRPGRIARIVNGEGDPETVMVGQPFTPGPVPKPAQQGDPNAQNFTLTEHAKFNVVVKVTKNYDTRREQEATVIGELLSAAPMLMTWFGDLYFKNQDGPGHAQMAERAKVMLDPKIQAMLAEASKNAPMPPEAQAQIAQMQGQLQQMQQQLQQASQIIQTKQVESQGDIQQTTIKAQADDARAKLDAQVKLEIARMDNATKLQIEELKIRGTMMQRELDAQEVALGAVSQQQSQESAQAHEAAMGAAGAASSASESEAGRQHATTEAEAARDAQAQQADADRAIALQQQADSGQP